MSPLSLHLFNTYLARPTCQDGRGHGGSEEAVQAEGRPAGKGTGGTQGDLMAGFSEQTEQRGGGGGKHRSQ